MQDLILFLFIAGIAWLLWRAFAGKTAHSAQISEQPSKEYTSSALICAPTIRCKQERGVSGVNLILSINVDYDAPRISLLELDAN